MKLYIEFVNKNNCNFYRRKSNRATARCPERERDNKKSLKTLKHGNQLRNLFSQVKNEPEAFPCKICVRSYATKKSCNLHLKLHRIYIHAQSASILFQRLPEWKVIRSTVSTRERILELVLKTMKLKQIVQVQKIPSRKIAAAATTMKMMMTTRTGQLLMKTKMTRKMKKISQQLNPQKLNLFPV